MDATMFDTDGGLNEAGMSYLEPLVFAGHSADDVIASEEITDPMQQKAVSEFWETSQVGIIDQPDPSVV